MHPDGLHRAGANGIVPPRRPIRPGRAKWREPIVMKISARNHIQGKVVEIVKGTVAAKVKVDIGGGNVLTSMVLAESVDHLGLKVGDPVSAIVKSTEVMLSK